MAGVTREVLIYGKPDLNLFPRFVGAASSRQGQSLQQLINFVNHEISQAFWRRIKTGISVESIYNFPIQLSGSFKLANNATGLWFRQCGYAMFGELTAFWTRGGMEVILLSCIRNIIHSLFGKDGTQLRKFIRSLQMKFWSFWSSQGRDHEKGGHSLLRKIFPTYQFL